MTASPTLSVVIRQRDARSVRRSREAWQAAGLDVEVLVAADASAEAEDAELARARGRWLCLFEAGALPLAAGFARLLAFAEAAPELALAYGRIAGVRLPGQLAHPYVGGRDEVRELLLDNYIPPGTAIFRREVLDAAGPLAAAGQLRQLYVWDWTLRAASCGRVGFLDDDVVEGEVLRPKSADVIGERLTLWSRALLATEAPPLLTARDFHMFKQSMRRDLATLAPAAAERIWAPAIVELQKLQQAFYRRREAAFLEKRRLALPYTPGVAPWPLQGLRRRVFLHLPNWRDDGWRAVVRAYAEAFGPEADATLVLRLDPGEGLDEAAAVERVMGLIGELGLAPELAPDMLLVPDEIPADELPRLYAAADVVVCPGDALTRTRAALMGKPTLRDLSPAAWRAALGEA